jgi:hypothetical protein
MSKYDKQGSRMRDLGGGIKAPRYGFNDKIERMAAGKTTGIVKQDQMPKSNADPGDKFDTDRDWKDLVNPPYQHKFKG